MDLLFALLLTFGLMWLLLIRPQQRRMRAHQQVVSSLAPGDDVVTAGGIHGVVTAVDTDDVRIEIAPGVVIRVLRGAISQRTGPPVEEEVDEDEEDLDEEDLDEEELDEVDEVVEVVEVVEVDEVDGVDQVDGVDRVDRVDEVDQVEPNGSRRTSDDGGS